jgi:hypothetical protein
MRRPLPLVAIAALVLLAALGVGAPAATGQTDSTTSTTTPIRDSDTGLNDIVPQPNSGEAPDDPSDRGGWQQYLVFGLIIGGMAVIVVIVTRQSRRARAAQP